MPVRAPTPLRKKFEKFSRDGRFEEALLTLFSDALSAFSDEDNGFLGEEVSCYLPSEFSEVEGAIGSR